MSDAFPLDVPAGTTIEALVTSVVPALHARLVPHDAPRDAFAIAVRIEGAGSWMARVCGREMRVEDCDDDRAGALWLWTTTRAVERLLEDLTGPKLLVPKFAPPEGGVVLGSDPRLLKRVTMASGRIELALRDVDGERLAIVLGFGAAAKKGIDPDDADVVVEAGLATLQRVLSGEIGPEDALADGDVRVKGNRLFALQLALAVAPFHPAARR